MVVQAAENSTASMAENPNHTHPGVARCLLGIGPIPPPWPQDIALACVQGALNTGTFGQTGLGTLCTGLPY